MPVPCRDFPITPGDIIDIDDREGVVPMGEAKPSSMQTHERVESERGSFGQIGTIQTILEDSEDDLCARSAFQQSNCS